MSQPWAEQPSLGRRQVVFDAATALLFALVAVPVHVAQGAWMGAAAVVLALALAVRRIAVPAMVPLAVVGGLLQLIGGDIAYLADAAYVVLFLTLGGHREARLRRLGLVAAVVAVVVAMVWSSWMMSGGPDRSVESALAAGAALGALCAVFTLGGWAGGFVRYQRRLAEQALIAARFDAVERRRLQQEVEQEQERAQIATDMHDLVAHSWAVVAAQADGARYALRGSPDEAEQALAVIGETARSAMTDLRVIVAQLRNQETTDPVPAAVREQQLLHRLRASGMCLEHQVTGSPHGSPLVTLTAHRLLSEALTNALKHGDLAEPVTAVQDWTDGYRLEVVNAVPRTPAAAPGTGHGIIGMTERASVAGGRLTSTREGERWILRAHLPVHEEPR